jgi:hypothetical protein
MQELNLRLGQAVALTYAQTDENFKRLKTAIDALEVSVAGAGLGTVTSVGLTMPNIFTVTNSPVTTTGSLTATLASQSANSFFASPNGASGQPTFRGLVAEDLPTVPINKGGLNLTTVVPINQVLASTGTGYEGRAISVVPFSGLTLTQGTGSIEFSLDPTNINLASLGGVLTVAKGGTGLSAPPANGTLLIGNGVAYTNALLTAGSGISITNGVGTITIANTATGVSQLNSLTGPVTIGFGSSGNDVNVTTPTTSDITLNIPSAGPSPIVRGLLTAADWTTFNNKVSSTGTANYVPRFTSANVIQNGIMYDTGARIGINTIAPTYELDIQQFAGGPADTTLRVKTTATSYHANLRLETSVGAALILSSTGRIQNPGGDINFQGITTGPTLFNNGNVIFRKGIAFGQYAYHNAAANYTFIDNTFYGVILGPASGAANTITLPTSPMEGQEIAVLTERDKTGAGVSFAAGATPIFGHNGGTGILMTITGGSAKGSAMILAKYSFANGTGAWYVSVSE